MSDADRASETFRAECWCGWRGEVRTSEMTALADAVDHAAATGHVPPDAAS